MKNILQRILPKKNHFMGVDIGTSMIKVAEVEVVNDVPEVADLRCYPAPPGVWTEQFDEENLVSALKEVANPQLKEVITCIGGEKLISRIILLPKMSDKELDTAARFELEKFVPTPVDQLIVRHIRLDEGLATQDQKEGENILLLAVPSATIYQYHSIFSRAGMTLTAIDLKAFALWRLFGKTSAGIVAIVEIGAKTSQLVVVKDSLIRFVRLLPVGGDILTGRLMEAYGVEFSDARQMKEEAAVTEEDEHDQEFGSGQIRDILREGLDEISREITRSLDFYSNLENLSVGKVIISGGTCKLKGLAEYLKNALNLPVEEGILGFDLPEGMDFDPRYSVAIGLALREVLS
ncbi:MAG: type IV pilus assembly protein PilM [Eubacteriales bacterium]